MSTTTISAVDCGRCQDCGYISWWDARGRHDYACGCAAGRKLAAIWHHSENPEDSKP